MKQCTACREVKDLSEFGVRNSQEDGLNTQCKPCVRIRNKNYYQRDKVKSSKQRADYYAANKNWLNPIRAKYYQENREAILLKQSEFKKVNLEAIRKRAREWAKSNRDKINSYTRERYRTKPLFRLYGKIRRLCSNAIYQIGRSNEHVVIAELGYSPYQLGQRLSMQFKPGMGWHNYGEWHLDHKIPVAYFASKGECRNRVISCLCNLQPLWAKENILKSDLHPLRDSI